MRRRSDLPPLALLVALAAAAAPLAAPAKYTSKYDNIDVDAILRNDRLLNKYVECLLGPTDSGCTADGRVLKRLLPDALADNCAKCTDQQKEYAHKVIVFLQQNKPAVWQRLHAKFDPDGAFAQAFDDPAP